MRNDLVLAVVLVVAVCVGLWVAAVITGAPVWSSHAMGIERNLARNAAAIAVGQWWRIATYGFVNLGIEALAFVMALLVLAGAQIERTYGSVGFLAVFVASLLAAAPVALLVEPVHAFNAGTSGAALGVGAAATIDLHRRGTPLHRTFWAPIITVLLILGIIFPATVTWGAHLGGVVGGAAVGAVLCKPAAVDRQRRLLGALMFATAIAVSSGLLASWAAHHTVAHGPVLIGVGPTTRGAHRGTALEPPVGLSTEEEAVTATVRAREPDIAGGTRERTALPRPAIR